MEIIMTTTKLCECGCGLPTPIAFQSIRGYKKGDPQRFLQGHSIGHRYEPDPIKRAAKELNHRRRYKKEQRERMCQYVLDYLATHPCIDCGETDLIVLDFDHRDPSEKYKSIAQIKGGGLGINVLIAEIEKCDVRCANCHRRKHYNQPFRKILGNY
jgi:hypothetical protein